MNYKVVKRGEPGVAGGGTQKYYASPLYSGEIDLEALSRKLSNGSTLTEADIIAVITRLVYMVGEELMEGKIVHLGKLGTFRLSLSSQGEESLDKVSVASIKNVKTLFRPGKSFAKKLSNIVIEKGKDVSVNPDEAPAEEAPADEVV